MVPVPLGRVRALSISVALLSGLALQAGVAVGKESAADASTRMEAPKPVKVAEDERPAKGKATEDERPSKGKAADAERPAKGKVAEDDRPAKGKAGEEDRPAKGKAGEEDRPAKGKAAEEDRSAKGKAAEESRPGKSRAAAEDRPARSKVAQADAEAEGDAPPARTPPPRPHKHWHPASDAASRAHLALLTTAHGNAPAAVPSAVAPAPAAALPVAAASAAHAVDSHGGTTGTPHWTYEGENGPATWAQLAPEFAACGNGQRQSPIDIRDGIKLELDPIVIDYRETPFRVIDNGHTVQVNVSSGNFIKVMGRRFSLVQFHFHHPSEELIDGHQSEMVIHLVHKDADGKTAVLAVLLERGARQPEVQQVWNNLPLERNEEQTASSRIDLAHLLPEDRRYFTYMGSLTTPPCTEGVLWIVMKQPVQVSAAQIDLFARLYPFNARPTQAAAGRMIKESN